MKDDSARNLIDGPDPAATDVLVNGIRLRVRSAGSGRPVILLHGFPDSHLVFQHQIGALAAAGFRVLAPDLRGFGESDRPSDVAAYRMPLLVGDVAAILDHFDVPTAAVVGHDWGAGLAWQFAIAHPGRVDRLAVLSVGHGGADGGFQQQQLSWYMLWFLFEGVAEKALPADDWAFFRKWAWGLEPGRTNADCERQIRDLSRPGALIAGLNWYRANINPAFLARTEAVNGPKIHCPTMGVWSSADDFLGEAQMRDSAKFCPAGFRFERLDDVGHWLTQEAPAQVSALLVDFLGEETELAEAAAAGR